MTSHSKLAFNHSTYLSIDNEGTFFTLSLYNVNTEKINEKLQK